MNRLYTPRRFRDDAGLSLIEVVIATVILTLSMAAVASMLTRSLKVARDSREQIVATQVAQYELERLRTIPFLDWVSIAGNEGSATETYERTGPDGQVFQAYREATWVSAGSDSDSCSSTGNGSDYVRVRLVVTFPDRDIPPVEQVTIITPRMEFYDPNTSAVTVKIFDRDGEPQRNMAVRLEGSGTNTLMRTDQNGCAFFPFVPVNSDGSPTGYRIKVRESGYVDIDTHLSYIDKPITVIGGSDSIATFTYDRGVQYSPVPVYDAPPANDCVPTLVSYGSQNRYTSDVTSRAQYSEGGAPNRQGIECRSGSTALPNGWSAHIPYNVAYRMLDTTGDIKSLTYPRLDRTAVHGTLLCAITNPDGTCESDVFFPEASGFSVHAGRCSSADPGSASRKPYSASRGDLITYGGYDPGRGIMDPEWSGVPMAVVTIQAVPHNNDAQRGRRFPYAQVDIYADMTGDASCQGGDRLYLGRTDGYGRLTALMPYGDWVFFADRSGGGVDGNSPVVLNRDGTVRSGPVSCTQYSRNCVTINPPGVGDRPSNAPQYDTWDDNVRDNELDHFYTGYTDIGYYIEVENGYELPY